MSSRKNFQRIKMMVVLAESELIGAKESEVEERRDDFLLKKKKLADRSKVQTLCEILQSLAKGERSITRIMFQANTCWISLQEHLQVLKGSQVIYEEIDSECRKSFHLTPKGFAILEHYGNVKELF